MVSSSDGLNRRSRKRSRNTKIIVTAVVVVLLIVVLVGLHMRGAFPWLFSENPRYSHSFSLVIDPETALDFTVICPVPVNASGSLYSDFIDELEVTSGNPQYILVDTEYGYGLQASGSGHTRLHWEGNWRVGDGDWYLNMSMTNAPHDWDYDTPEGGFWSWIYSSNETLSISLTYTAERMHNETPTWLSGGGPCFYIGEMLEEGWHQIFLDYGWIVIN